MKVTMNENQLKNLFCPTQFKTQNQAPIHAAVEQLIGLPAANLCVFIAKLAERISGGELTTQDGLLVVFDRGKNAIPVIMAHCWNAFEGRRIDLSPWSECPYAVEYLIESDAKYGFYRQQTTGFAEPSDNLHEEDINMCQ
jgi:hypothetical protein